MLTYLIYGVEDLISTAILCGLALAYARAAWDDVCGTKVMTGSVIAGVVLSAAMAIAKHTTNLVDTGLWNMRIFWVAFAALVVLLICFVKPIAKQKIGKRIALFALALFVLLRVFYKLPDVFVYPFTITVSNYLSSDFVLRVTGYVLGLAIVVLAAIALYKMLKDADRRPIGLGVSATATILGVVQLMICIQTMLARRMIAQSHELFLIVKWFSNSSTLFMLVIMAIAAALAVLVIVRSLRDDEPYDNPAQHRRNKARWRNRRRWAICLIVCVVLAALTVTVIYDYNNRGPELSPSEECEIKDGCVYVSFEQVEDGHLHRFTFETKAGDPIGDDKTATGGVGVRFIIIKKPNSSAYGIGLDACEICGQTGYYERDGQVVCKLCDVVMNINTIGFKGGCNPIPIEYRIENGQIIIPCDALTAYEKTFK